MIKEYKDSLNIGEYGEYIMNYHTSEYITDIITYIADSNVDIYNYKLWEWAKNNQEHIETAIEHGYYNIDSRSFDLIKLFQAGQYLYIMDDLYNNIDNIVAYAVLEELEEEFMNKERLVEVIDDTCINVDNNRTIEYYIDIVRDEMQDYPMLEIHLLTGSAWNESILVEGSKQDDLLALIDEYYYEHDDLPVPMFTLDEVLEGESFKTQEEEWEYIDSLEMLPINGGEFYIYGVDHVQEVI